MQRTYTSLHTSTNCKHCSISTIKPYFESCADDISTIHGIGVTTWFHAGATATVTNHAPAAPRGYWESFYAQQQKHTIF